MNPYFIIQVYNERCNLFQSINLADFLKKNDANSIVHERPVRVWERFISKILKKLK
jgi:hypothetical protein